MFAKSDHATYTGWEEFMHMMSVSLKIKRHSLAKGPLVFLAKPQQSPATILSASGAAVSMFFTCCPNALQRFARWLKVGCSVTLYRHLGIPLVNNTAWLTQSAIQCQVFKA